MTEPPVAIITRGEARRQCGHRWFAFCEECGIPPLDRDGVTEDEIVLRVPFDVALRFSLLPERLEDH